MMESATLINLKKNINKILITLGILYLIYIIFVADYGYLKRIELEKQSQELEIQIQAQKKIEDSIKISIQKLTNDTNEIEKIAREKYGMTKPNEEVYHIKKNE